MDHTDSGRGSVSTVALPQRPSYSDGKVSLATQFANNKTPFALLGNWIQEATEAGATAANAMNLCTVDADGQPQGRILFLRRLCENGFVFGTHGKSPKVLQLRDNCRAAVTFWWPETERQVRVLGAVEILGDEAARDDFVRRPRESRLVTWASCQSEPISDPCVIREAVVRARERYGTGEVPWSSNWILLCLVADKFEFWQGGPHRLNERLAVRRDGGAKGEASWLCHHLAP